MPGVSIDILAIDCLDTEKTSALFTQTQRRIAGVFYVAVQLNDQLFVNLKSEKEWKAGNIVSRYSSCVIADMALY